MSLSNPTFFDDVLIFCLVLWILSYCTVTSAQKPITRFDSLSKIFQFVENNASVPASMKHGDSCTGGCDYSSPPCPMVDDDCLKATLTVSKNMKTSGLYVNAWDWSGAMYCHKDNLTCQCLKGPSPKDPLLEPQEIYAESKDKACQVQNLEKNHECLGMGECKKGLQCLPVDVPHSLHKKMYQISLINTCSDGMMAYPRKTTILLVNFLIVFIFAHL